jgi:hypothetical protein
MVFFKRNSQNADLKPKKSLPQTLSERVLTAEGWRRRVIQKQAQKAK